MPSAPYDTIETVVNTARVRMNDAIQGLGGDIFTDTAVFTLTMVNAAWRRLQELLADYGFAALERDIVLTAVPACTTNDQGIFVWFNWSEYFNGTGNVAAPILPQDLIAPLDMFERLSGTTTNFVPMDQVQTGGLPTAPRTPLNQLWEWRQETIFMPGALNITDIRLRYAGYLADFTAINTTPTQPVPIMRSLNSFAWFICSEMARSRGDMDAGSFDVLAQTSATYIFNRDYTAGKTLFKRSELGKMPDQYSAADGPEAPRGQGSKVA